MNRESLYLREGARRLDLILKDDQLVQFDEYQKLLLEWNQKINLTSITEPVAVYSKHFLDSLSCTKAMGDLTGLRVVDVGSGAGFPGLPLKIYNPKMRLTLVESVAKKARFLETVTRTLGLDGVEIVVGRIEAIGQDPNHRSSYDWAVARAVARLNVLVEYLIPLCKVGGSALAQKSTGVQAELEAAQNAIKIIGGGSPRLFPVEMMGQHDQDNRMADRYLVVIDKIEPTPGNFPRRVGVPSKRPL